VVTRPFKFEKRLAIAERGILELQEHVDSLITIPNDKLLNVLGERASILEAFAAANDVLLGAVQGIADLIIRHGLINVDFADVRTVMSEMGMAMMGTGRASGEHRAQEAAEAAIKSPLLEDVDLHGARGILVNVTAGPDLAMGDFIDVGNVIEEYASDHATVVIGTVIDPSMGDELKVTVVATGLGEPVKPSVVVNNTVSAPPPATEEPPLYADHRGDRADGRADMRSDSRGDSRADSRADGRAEARGENRPDYGNDLDRPTIFRQRDAVVSHQSNLAFEQDSDDMEWIDIPAFLRRQAD
jgi:cell division protein FtsZ